jgi:hypothetical protein
VLFRSLVIPGRSREPAEGKGSQGPRASGLVSKRPWIPFPALRAAGDDKEETYARSLLPRQRSMAAMAASESMMSA